MHDLLTTRTSATTLRMLLLGALGITSSSCGEDPLHCRTARCASASPEGTGGLGGGTGGFGAGGTGGHGVAGASEACMDPTPLIEGEDTGIFRCGQGYLHRAEAKECPNELPRPRTVEWPESEIEGLGGLGGVGGNTTYTVSGDECSRDADCGEKERCELVLTNEQTGCEGLPPFGTFTPAYGRLCVSGCVTDADCGPSAVCVCSSPIGHCMGIAPDHGCQTDADCAEGSLCLGNARPREFAGHQFACQLPADECQSDDECTSGYSYCKFGAEGRTCEGASICGRPFLVEDVPRTAPSVAFAWGNGKMEPESSSFELQVPDDPRLRATLAAHWTRIGLLEHASIAAFARFTLQLLSLGAPAELIEASNRAQRDETRHARVAFALASRFGGRPVGPGPLSMDGALADATPAGILLTTIEEGCVGETRAALEASDAAASCADPVLRAVLETIAADEARHAELAWRVVHWIVARDPALLGLAEQRFAENATDARGATGPRAAEANPAERHGVLGSAALGGCHWRAQQEVIEPCFQALRARVA